VSLYRNHNVRSEAVRAYINNPIWAEMKCYDAQQSFFNLESLLDMLDKNFGFCPLDLCAKKLEKRDKSVRVALVSVARILRKPRNMLQRRRVSETMSQKADQLRYMV
jgi:hypothetical protein